MAGWRIMVLGRRRYQLRAGGAGAPLQGRWRFDADGDQRLVPLVASAAVIAGRDGGAEDLAGFAGPDRSAWEGVPRHIVPRAGGVASAARLAGAVPRLVAARGGAAGAAGRAVGRRLAGLVQMCMGRRRLSWPLPSRCKISAGRARSGSGGQPSGQHPGVCAGWVAVSGAGRGGR